MVKILDCPSGRIYSWLVTMARYFRGMPDAARSPILQPCASNAIPRKVYRKPLSSQSHQYSRPHITMHPTKCNLVPEWASTDLMVFFPTVRADMYATLSVRIYNKTSRSGLQVQSICFRAALRAFLVPNCPFFRMRCCGSTRGYLSPSVSCRC